MKKIYVLFMLLCGTTLKANWIHRIMNKTNAPVIIQTINGVGQVRYYLIGPKSGWNIHFYAQCIQGLAAIVPDKFKNDLGPKAKYIKEIGDAIHFFISSNRCSWKEVIIDYNENAPLRYGSYFSIKETNYQSGYNYVDFRFAPEAPQDYQSEYWRNK